MGMVMKLRQSSLMYVFVLFFGLDRAQDTMPGCLLLTAELTNGNFLVT